MTNRTQALVPDLMDPDKFRVMKNYCGPDIDQKPVGQNPITGQLDLKVRSFYGVAPVVLKAYAWIMSLAAPGLYEVAKVAGLLAQRFLEGKCPRICEQEVLDIDENAYGQGRTIIMPGAA